MAENIFVSVATPKFIPDIKLTIISFRDMSRTPLLPGQEKFKPLQK